MHYLLSLSNILHINLHMLLFKIKCSSLYYICQPKLHSIIYIHFFFFFVQQESGGEDDPP